MRNRVVDILFGLVFAIIICSLLLLAAIYPYRPEGAGGWIVLLVLSVPLVLIIQFLGKLLLETNVVEKTNRPIRLLIGVITIMVFSALVIWVYSFAKPYLIVW